MATELHGWDLDGLPRPAFVIGHVYDGEVVDWEAISALHDELAQIPPEEGDEHA